MEALLIVADEVRAQLAEAEKAAPPVEAEAVGEAAKVQSGPDSRGTV